jgi:predicted PurR-regulated permease PerM
MAVSSSSFEPDAPRRGPGPRAWWVLGIALLIAAAVVYALRSVFGPLFAALGIAYVLDPVVRHLGQRGLKRAWAVFFVFAIAALIAALLIAMVALQASELVQRLMTDSDGVVRQGVDNLLALIHENVERVKDDELGERLRNPETWTGVLQPVLTTFGGLLKSFAGWIEVAGALLLTPIYTYYLLLELPVLWGFVHKHLPGRDRERTDRVLAEIHEGMSAFLRGRVVIALLKGVLLAVALWAVGAPYAWVVGIVSGLLSVLPLIGPLLGWVIAVALLLVDLGDSGNGVWLVVWVTVVYLVAEAVENFLLTPWVMKEGVSLHPLTVLFCVFFWGAAFGAFGALLAIPLTIVLKIVLKEYLLPPVKRLAQAS